jgi:hypothetical protein
MPLTFQRPHFITLDNSLHKLTGNNLKHKTFPERAWLAATTTLVCEQKEETEEPSS